MDCLFIFTLCLLSYTVAGSQKYWQDLLHQVKQAESGRSGLNVDKMDLFDQILVANAKARGSEGGTSDDVTLNEGDIVEEQNAIGRGAGNYIRLWKPNTLRYTVHSDLADKTSLIQEAIKEWETALPCLGKWKQYVSLGAREDHIEFIKGKGCYSYIGRRNGKQVISLGQNCARHGIILHEIGHALGFFHEQARPDRDRYIRILWGNILKGAHSQFEKISRINSLGVPYDYNSIMHYGTTSFAKRFGLKTIEPINPKAQIGQRYFLSKDDKLQAQKLYKCESGSGCQKDLNSKCGQWAEKGYCKEKHQAYMKINCCKTCKVEESGCQKDLNSRCGQWAEKGYCEEKHQAYMKINCCKTCKARKVEVCVDDNPTLCQKYAQQRECNRFRFLTKRCCKSCKDACRNFHDNCDRWASKGYCTKTYQDYMKRNCCKSCEGKMTR